MKSHVLSLLRRCSVLFLLASAMMVGAVYAAHSSAKGVVWSADHETGDITQWYAPGTSKAGNHGGAPENSGQVDVVVTRELAHSGQWSAKLSIGTPSKPTSGARMFRWKEPREHRELYYSVWIYIPTRYELTGERHRGHFWNLLQFKSRTSDNSHNDPLWAFYIDDSQRGAYYLKAGWGWGNAQVAGPSAGDGTGGKWFTERVAPLPIGRWVHLETFLRESSDFDGRLTLWQDGVQIFDFDGVRTSYRNCDYNSWCADDEWSINLYSDGLSPNPATMYVDDAVIATEFVP